MQTYMHTYMNIYIYTCILTSVDVGVLTVSVAGSWGCWSGWSKCSSSCGIGRRTRTRTCNNPSKANGGASCVGTSTQSQVCPRSLDIMS